MILRNINRIFRILLLLYFVGSIVYIWINPGTYQWDFDIYYRGAMDYSNSQNPYLTPMAFPHVAHAANLNYVYPPITLLIFRIFTGFNYEFASHIYLVLKIIALITLVYIWSRYFLTIKANWLFLLFCLLGFNGAIGLDLMAGNISIFEQLLIWTGFYFLLRRYYALFGVCIIIAATFKIVPIIFLLLFLIQDDRNKYPYFAGFFAIFLLSMLVCYLQWPALFTSFIQNSISLSETGRINPSNLALIKDVFTSFAKGTGVVFPQWLPSIIFMMVVAAIVIASGRVFGYILKMQTDDKRLILILFSCLVYALILPRFKDYSYIMLLVPSYYIILKFDKIKAFPILFVLLILSGSRFMSMPGMDSVYRAFWAYYPLILAYLVWGLYLYFIIKMQFGGAAARNKNVSIE